MARIHVEYPRGDALHLGLDEAGRGALWGPVACGGVVLGEVALDDRPVHLRDSKRVSPKNRELVRSWIEEHAKAWHVELVPVEVIEERNIRQAVHEGWLRCIERLWDGRARVLVDGNDFRHPGAPDHETVVKGDDRYACIAAASIMAKTERDRWVEEHAPEGDPYSLRTNKGYGSVVHCIALRDVGLHALHRPSFCRRILEAGASSS